VCISYHTCINVTAPPTPPLFPPPEHIHYARVLNIFTFKIWSKANNDICSCQSRYFRTGSTVTFYTGVALSSSVYTRFVVEKVVLDQVFGQLFQFFLISIIPPMFHTQTHSSTINTTYS
jgi:hypothetical protein